MKVLLIVMFLAAQVQANPIQDLSKWVGKQDVRSGAMMDMAGRTWGASYLAPVSYGTKGWRHKSKGSKPYLDAIIGAAYKPKTKSKALIGFLTHPLNIGSWVLSKLPKGGKLARDRFKITPLPNLAIGPTFALGEKEVKQIFNGRIKDLRGSDIVSYTIAYKFGK